MRLNSHMRHLCHYSSFSITLHHIQKFIHNHHYRKRYPGILKNTFADKSIIHMIEFYNEEKMHSLIHFDHHSCIIYETEFIHQVISSLPEEEQKIIILFLNGYITEDIADLLKLPNHIIQFKLYRIHKQFKNKYRPQKSK